MPRFVILEHTGTPTYKPGRHWDLMLESGGRLRTWELGTVPSASCASRAQALPDHRLQYLEYEGPLTDGRGYVRQFDAGAYEFVREGQDELIIHVAGRQLQCQLVLKRDQAAPSIWHVSVKSPACSSPSLY